MRTSLPATIPVLAGFAASAAMLALAACGGGGGSATTSGTTPDTPAGGQGPVTTIAELMLPQRRANWAGLQPVLQFGDELRIGGMPPPARAALSTVATHGQATVSYGTVRDGVGAATLIDYLQRDATDRQTRPGTIFRFDAAPTVRYVEGTTAAEIDEIVLAVQLINANLPRDFQLTVEATPVSAADDAAGLGALAGGEILVEYDRREDWEISYTAGSDQTGLALTQRSGSVSTVARVWVDDTRAHDSMATLVHELGHALGRFHPDRARFPGTVMNSMVMAVEGYVLHPLDREALLAVYGTLSPGATPGEIATDLGPWDVTVRRPGDRSPPPVF